VIWITSCGLEIC